MERVELENGFMRGLAGAMSVVGSYNPTEVILYYWDVVEDCIRNEMGRDVLASPEFEEWRERVRRC